MSEGEFAGMTATARSLQPCQRCGWSASEFGRTVTERTRRVSEQRLLQFEYDTAPFGAPATMELPGADASGKPFCLMFRPDPFVTREGPWKDTNLLHLEGISRGLGTKHVESIVSRQLLENLDAAHAISFTVEAG